MYRRRRRAELRHDGAGSGSGGSVANQLGGAPAEPSWSMEAEAEAEAAEQSMLTAGAMACPGPPARSCRAKAALVPRAEARWISYLRPEILLCTWPLWLGPVWCVNRVKRYQLPLQKKNCLYIELDIFHYFLRRAGWNYNVIKFCCIYFFFNS